MTAARCRCSSLGNDNFVDVSHVLLQMGLLPEGPGTEVALERLGARVDHRMDGQVTGRGEGFATHSTAVAFFAVAFRIVAGATGAAVAAVGVFVCTEIGGCRVFAVLVHGQASGGGIAAEIGLTAATSRHPGTEQTLKTLKFGGCRCGAVLAGQVPGFAFQRRGAQQVAGIGRFDLNGETRNSPCLGLFRQLVRLLPRLQREPIDASRRTRKTSPQ